MHLSIVTPQKAIYDGDISSLTAPTATGEITILPEHINLLTQLVPGELTIKSDKTTQYMGITGGFLELNNDSITILADFAVPSEHVAVEKVIEAQQRAEELKKRMQENLSEEDMAIAAGELRRSLMELHVAQRKRHRHI
jgi:F-type H+-transporting ATPase subunit epsilon